MSIATSRCPHLRADTDLDTREVDRTQILADGERLADFPIPDHYDDFGPYGDRLRTWHIHTDPGHDTTLADILDRFAMDEPVDGDCLDTAPAVTDALTLAGLPATTVTIAGWLDENETLLACLHLATRTSGLILDATARQFDRSLPAAWIAHRDDYLHELATATGIDHASIPNQTPISPAP